MLELILNMKKTLAQLTAEQTGGIGLDEVTSDADRDHWFTAQEAKEYGFVDHVIEHSSSLLKN